MLPKLNSVAVFAVTCLLFVLNLSEAREHENLAQRAQRVRQRRVEQAAPKVPQLDKRYGNESYRFYNDKTARMPGRESSLAPN